MNPLPIAPYFTRVVKARVWPVKVELRAHSEH